MPKNTAPLRIILSLLIILLFLIFPQPIAAANEGINFQEEYPVMYQTARKYASGWDEGNAEKILSTFTSDGTYIENGGSFSMKNQEAAKDFLNSMFLSDSHFKIITLTTDGKNTVDLNWEISGEYQGKSYAVRGVDILKMEGDKIQFARGYADPEEFAEIFAD